MRSRFCGSTRVDAGLVHALHCNSRSQFSTARLIRTALRPSYRWQGPALLLLVPQNLRRIKMKSTTSDEYVRPMRVVVGHNTKAEKGFHSRKKMPKSKTL